MDLAASPCYKNTGSPSLDFSVFLPTDPIINGIPTGLILFWKGNPCYFENSFKQ